MSETGGTGDLGALIRGEKRAWDDFVTAYGDTVHWTVRRVLVSAGAHQDVADVFQDTFLRLCRNDFLLIRRFDASRSSLSTYVKVVARTAALDHLRRRRRNFTSELDSGQPAHVDPVEPSSIGVPDDLLTGRQRLVLTLLYERDLDVAEIAEKLQISRQTVRSTHHKAINRLRDYFGEEDRP